jgi:hypothetical protein
MARLIRTSAIIEDCEAIVSSPELMGSPIESYLVQHALVVLCAEIQEEIYEIVRVRAAQADDQQLANFVSNVAQKVLRSVGKSELAGFVGHFGQGEKAKFNQLVHDAEVTKYNNAVNSRHDVAHRSGAQVTFSELKDAVSAASNILHALASSIEIEAHAELAG